MESGIPLCENKIRLGECSTGNNTCMVWSPIKDTADYLATIGRDNGNNIRMFI
jgi:hypothetical protein